jgi:hypothetical protein
MTRCLASLPGVRSGDCSPASTVLSRHCDFLPSIPPHFVSFTWRYHGSTHLSLPPLLRGTASGQGLVTRYPHPGILRGNGRISQVPGEPQFPFAHVLRPRPAAASLTVDRTLAWPPLKRRRRRRRQNGFRGSIAWLSGSPPTFHVSAQGWLPGAGQALLDGLSPAEFLQKVFNSLHVRWPPFPSFLAQLFYHLPFYNLPPALLLFV